MSNDKSKDKPKLTNKHSENGAVRGSNLRANLMRRKSQKRTQSDAPEASDNS